MVLQKYLTQLILSYARRYIRNIEANLNISLWGGDVVLNNLDLRLDVLQRELGVPREFEFSRGFIKELRIHIPWTSLTSRPVEVTLTDVECVLNFKTHVGDYSGGGGGSDSHPSSGNRPRLHSGAQNHPPPKLEAAEAEEVGGSGWAADLVTKILSNVTVKINGLSFNFVEELQGHRIPPSTSSNQLSQLHSSPSSSSLPPDRQIMLSLRIVQMLLQSTNSAYSAQFAELEGPWKLIHKTFEMKHVSIHLGELSKEAPHTKNNVGVAIKTGVSISRPTPRVLSDADAAAILKDMSFTLRIRTYLAAFGGSSMIRLPYMEDQPPPLSGAAMTFQLHIHQAADLYLSDQQLQFLLHIIQTKAGFVSVQQEDEMSSSATSKHEDERPSNRRSSAPAVITASSLQHLALPESPLASTVPPSPPLRPSLTTSSSTTSPSKPPPPPTPAPAKGWTAWIYDMVAEEEEEDELDAGNGLASGNIAQEFYDAYGHLAPKDEIVLGFQIPAITLHLLHASRQKTTESTLLGGLTSKSTSDSLLTVKLERITVTHQRSSHSSSAPNAPASGSINASLTSPNSRPPSTRSTPASSAADQSHAIAMAALNGVQMEAYTNGTVPPTNDSKSSSSEGMIRIGNINVSYTDHGESKDMFTWLAHGHPSGPGIEVSTHGLATPNSVVLVGEWSSQMLEWEIFAFDLFIPFDLVARTLTVCEPLLRPTTKSKSAPPPPDAAAQRRRRYKANYQTVKLVMHAGRVRIGHVPAKMNSTEQLAAAVQWQIIHLLVAATQCEPGWQHAIMTDSIELRVVDLTVSVDQPTSTTAYSSGRSVKSLSKLLSSSPTSMSSMVLTPSTDSSSVCLSPMTCVIQVIHRAKILTIDPDVALFIHTFTNELSPLPSHQRILLPFYRDSHIDIRIQNLYVSTEPDQVIHILTISEAFRQLFVSGAAPSTTTPPISLIPLNVQPDPLLTRQCQDDFRTLKAMEVVADESKISPATAQPQRPRPGHIMFRDQADGTRTIQWKYPSPRAITRLTITPFHRLKKHHSAPLTNGDASPMYLYGLLCAWDPITSTFTNAFDLLVDILVPTTIDLPNPPIVASEWKFIWSKPTSAQRDEWSLQHMTKYRQWCELLSNSENHSPTSAPPPPIAIELAQMIRVDSQLYCQIGTNMHLTLSIADSRIGVVGRGADGLTATDLIVLHLKGVHSHLRLWQNHPRQLTKPELGVGSAMAFQLRLDGVWINSHQHSDMTQYPLLLPMKVSLLLRQNRLHHSEVDSSLSLNSIDAHAAHVMPFLPITLFDGLASSPHSPLHGWCLEWNHGETKLHVRTQLLIRPKLISHRIQEFLDHLPESISRAAAMLVPSSPSHTSSSSHHHPPSSTGVYYIPHHPSGLSDAALPISPTASLFASLDSQLTRATGATSSTNGASSPTISVPWLHHPPPVSAQLKSGCTTWWCVDFHRLQTDRPAVTIDMGVN